MMALLIAGFSFFSPISKADSTGTETVDGKIFVIHQVAEKETLYGISKRYGTSMDEIIKYNPNADAGLEIGRILKVPYVRKVASKAPVGGVMHTVKEKETLYSISRLYNVDMGEIKSWNNLTSENLTLGQVLTIRKSNAATVTPIKQEKGRHQVAAGETLFSISRLYNIPWEELRKMNGLQSSDLKIGQILIVTPVATNTASNSVTSNSDVKSSTVTTTAPVSQSPIVVSPVTSAPQVNTEAPVNTVTAGTVKPAVKEPVITISESVQGSDEIVQGGLAELIEGTEGNRKYLALHRTAPVGTILKIRNEMNNREVFVRVMGKLPDTALNDKLVIKISKSAYDRLGAIDPRFRVEVTFYKPQ
jgi:LysM repeat protein